MLGLCGVCLLGQYVFFQIFTPSPLSWSENSSTLPNQLFLKEIKIKKFIILPALFAQLFCLSVMGMDNEGNPRRILRANKEVNYSGKKNDNKKRDQKAEQKAIVDPLVSLSKRQNRLNTQSKPNNNSTDKNNQRMIQQHHAESQKSNESMEQEGPQEQILLISQAVKNKSKPYTGLVNTESKPQAVKNKSKPYTGLVNTQSKPNNPPESLQIKMPVGHFFVNQPSGMPVGMTSFMRHISQGKVQESLKPYHPSLCPNEPYEFTPNGSLPINATIPFPNKEISYQEIPLTTNNNNGWHNGEIRVSDSE